MIPVHLLKSGGAIIDGISFATAVTAYAEDGSTLGTIANYTANGGPTVLLPAHRTCCYVALHIPDRLRGSGEYMRMMSYASFESYERVPPIAVPEKKQINPLKQLNQQTKRRRSVDYD